MLRLHMQPESALTRRLSLSMTVVRVVNGIADKLQQGKAAHSVMSLAVHGAGLPRWVVDMRHEVSTISAGVQSVPAPPLLRTSSAT
jgi:hypothetical protein